jgi:hypothetical protein
MRNLRLRTNVVTGCAGLFVTALLAAGCVDSKSRFNAFEDSVIDAAHIEPPDAGPDAMPIELPDVTGSFYVGFKVPEAIGGSVLHFIWDVQMTKNPDGTAEVVITSTPLHATNRTVVGTGTVHAKAHVNNAGQFQLVSKDYLIPGDADPLNIGDLVADFKSEVTIRSAVFMCGTVSEGVVHDFNAMLGGSTFAAQRIAPGTVGTNLPPAVLVCPPLTMPDGGLPDGGSPDAGPDASVIDAALPDV